MLDKLNSKAGSLKWAPFGFYIDLKLHCTADLLYRPLVGQRGRASEA